MGLIFLSSCGGKTGKEGNSNEISGAVRIDGSSTVYPITEAVAEEFRAEFPNIRVTAGFSGTGGGFKKFIRGDIDINDASRPIKEIEARDCAQNGIKYLQLKVAIDGLAVVVNKENKWLVNITVDQLKKIWDPSAQGKITRWSQIHPGWPDEEFHLYGAGVASGTYDYFTEVIVGETGASRGDYTASEDDNVLVQGIEGDKNALGFFGLAYYEENRNNLKLVGIDNGKGPVTPNRETIMSNTYSPLSRPLFIYVSESAAQRSEVVLFVNFFLKNVSSLVADVGYIPLPEEEYQEGMKQFKTFSSVK